MSSHSLVGASGGDASAGNVSDGLRLQLLRLPQKSAPKTDGRRAEMGRTDSGNGGRVDRRPLDGRRTAFVPGCAAALRPAEAQIRETKTARNRGERSRSPCHTLM